MPAPPEAADQVLTAQFMTELAKIGTPSTDWLTVPDLLREGSPDDALDEQKPLQLFFDHYQTGNRDDEAGTNKTHNWWYRARVWVAVKVTADAPTFGRKILRRAAADVWRCLQAAEGTFDTLSADEGLSLGTYQVRRDLVAAGFVFASIDVDVKRAQLHGAT